MADVITIVDVVDYAEAVDQYIGWCTECRKFTTGCVEPDARDYKCEACGEHTVMGAEEALMEGLIQPEDPPD